MATANDEVGLARAIRERLGVTSQRISQRVTELRDAMPMSRAEALGLLGHEVGIRINDYLTEETVTRVRDLVAVSALRPTNRKIAKFSNQDAETFRVKLEATRQKLREAERTARFQIIDDMLRERCLDLLNAKKGFDRAVNQALQVLETRVRGRAGLPKKLSGQDLMTRAIGSAGPLVFSDVDTEQQAAKLLFMGLYGFLRNPTHHRIEKIRREDAVVIVSFVDYLLKLVDESVVVTGN